MSQQDDGPTSPPQGANIDSYNERAKPFSWTKTADELFDKIKRKSINNTRH